ncbi:MAG: sugar ABC transporter substrate-binding protein [Patescibacteria group bacterium]
MKKTLIFLGVLVLVAVMAFGSTAGAAKRLRLVLSFHDPSIEWAQPMKNGVADAAAEFGFDGSFIGPSPVDAAKQIEQIKTLVEQGLVDGLAVTAMDQSFWPFIDELVDKGIPVVTVCNDAPKTKRLAYYGQPDSSLETTAYEETKKLCKEFLKGKRGEVAILNCLPEIQALQARVAGSQRAIKEFPNLKLLPGTYTKGTDVNKVYADIESLLTAHPKLVALIAEEAITTPTAAHVVRDKKLQKKVQVCGYDVTKEAVELVSDGSLDILVGQFPYKQGYLAMKALYLYITKGIKPETVDVGAEYITQKNVAEYMKSMGIKK